PVTVTTPVVAPAGTVVSIVESSVTENVAFLPANFTLVAPVKPTPLTVTGVPTGPEVGVSCVIDIVTLKDLVDVALPASVVTMTLPVVAPFPTVDWISVCVSEVIGAALWPILTFADESKPVPSIVTVVPVMPFSGLNEVIVGPCDCVGSGHTYAP